MGKKYFMQLAIKLAKEGTGFTHPNPSVGCVIAKNGKIIGKGWHKEFGKEHAEINAIADAWKRKGRKSTENVEMFVTLEPCCHYGKTGPCTKAIIKAGIKKVNVAMLDVNPIVAGRGIKELENAGIKIKVGLCRKEAEELNKEYIIWMKTKKPYVLLKIAITKNGKITWGDGKGRKITGKESQKKVHELRNKCNALLVGINTVLKDNPKLNCRLKTGRDPIKIILDPELKTPKNAKLFKSNAKTIIFCSKNRGKNKEKEMLGKNPNKKIEIIKVTQKNGFLNLKEVLREIGKRGITSILVEGGQKINSSFLKERLNDEILFFISQKKVKNGIDFIDETVKAKLKILDIKKSGKDLMLRTKQM
ncbi:MAG: bifunctional diaminohydroxyphosphoribosylaminopyrimidine deaminase/5-amino-6-(5-phosphoribosylamino)uracil reductase RibD [archaeon]